MALTQEAVLPRELCLPQLRIRSDLRIPRMLAPLFAYMQQCGCHNHAQSNAAAVSGHMDTQRGARCRCSAPDRPYQGCHAHCRGPAQATWTSSKASGQTNKHGVTSSAQITPTRTPCTAYPPSSVMAILERMLGMTHERLGQHYRSKRRSECAAQRHASTAMVRTCSYTTAHVCRPVVCCSREQDGGPPWQTLFWLGWLVCLGREAALAFVGKIGRDAGWYLQWRAACKRSGAGSCVSSAGVPILAFLHKLGQHDDTL